MSAPWDWITKLHELRESRSPAALVTVTRCQGSSPAAPGAKMIVTLGGVLSGTVGGGRFEQLAVADALACIESGGTKSMRYALGASAGQCCGGVVETFIEAFNVGPELYLFGAGHVGQALCRVLRDTPFTIHAVDEREEWLRELPAGVARHGDGWESFVASVRWSPARTYVAIMTHRHDLDEAIVEDVMKRETHYLGLIGSETKWRKFQERLVARGATAEMIGRVTCPIGLPIGGKSPAEVAISVAADLIRVHYGQPLSALSSAPPSA